MFSIMTTSSFEASDIKLGLKRVCRRRCGLNNLSVIAVLVSPKMHYEAVSLDAGDKEGRSYYGSYFDRVRS